MSGNWLVVSFFFQHTVRLYSLPGLVPGQEVNVTNPGAPRSSIDGLIYVPRWSIVTELKIAQGALSVRRNITVDAVIWGITSVAVGPQSGLLCIMGRYGTIHIVSVGDNVMVIPRLPMPDQMKLAISILALHTGQVLMTTMDLNLTQCSSVLYQELQPSLLTNLTQNSCTSIEYKDRFLVVDYLRSDILVLDAQGRLVHTADYGNGFIAGVRDLAVWQDSVFVVNFEGALLLLSPV